ncbi:hypothetical protein VWZ88_11065 [Phaeobacter sp. JH20_36]|uniref:hypothetical protein n=1 Tax=unclassified Phaeobacter TaxID=2621772 RepID=UPI003A8B6B43
MTALTPCETSPLALACPGSSAAGLAAVALVLVLGLPALMAPSPQGATPDWHGNSATLPMPGPSN